MNSGVAEMTCCVISEAQARRCRAGVAKFSSKKIFVTSGSANYSLKLKTFGSSSAVERSPVKRLVVGSIPTSRANKKTSEMAFF